jgi:predicted Zn-ribbon and HTH transcriptional regulator
MRFKRECKKCGYKFRPTGKKVILCDICNPHRKGRKRGYRGVELIKKGHRVFFR